MVIHAQKQAIAQVAWEIQDYKPDLIDACLHRLLSEVHLSIQNQFKSFEVHTQLAPS